jgi:hypothetical protein
MVIHSMTPFNEKDLDKILDDGFKNSELFSKWFLSKTRFSKLNASYKWSRSDNPWGRFTFEVEDLSTGKKEKITRDSETDILVVFEDVNKNNIALHIENKLANGSFTQYQPEFYSKRAEVWCNNEKFGNYIDFETVLVAPIEFYTNNFEVSQHFDKFVSYEEVGILLPEFSEYLAAHNRSKT